MRSFQFYRRICYFERLLREAASTIEIYYVHKREYAISILKSPDRNDLDPYNRQYDVVIDLSSKLLRYKLISILVKILDVVYIQITNISLASRLSCRSRSLT